MGQGILTLSSSTSSNNPKPSIFVTLFFTLSLPMEKNHKHLTNLLPYLAPIYFISLFYFPVSAYDQPYAIALNCGSADESPANGRNWTGDVGKNFTSQNEPNASVTATALRSPSAEQIPYSTARIFRSHFTYSFQVPSGPKFVRLYFFPSLYPEFDATTAFFSVRAGIYTFLSNFSASLAANHAKSDRIFKEFVINVPEEDNHWLNITFVPSLDGHAFVNGIEVVSMPNFLYYRPSTDRGIPIAGQGSAPNFFLENTSALETLYRLNVGGRTISPDQDTGMFRTWSMDDDFLSEFKGISLFNLTIQVKHSEQFPAYLAPDEVYQTVRSMGPNKRVNEMNNLSWTLPVHLGFNYLFRLHFCEIYPNISGPQDREFHIYIDRFTVEEQADVINWSGQNAAAAYRDYVVQLQRGGSQREYALLVEMHPNPTYRTSYSDVILNGIELFKLSNFTWSLAGPNPEAYVPSLAETPSPLRKRGKKMGDKIVVVSIVCGAAILMALLIVLVLKRRKSRKPDDRRNGTKTEGTSSLPSNRCHHFSIDDMRRATDNFNKAFILGIGGFGNVYKGYINDGITPVAIKRLNPGSQQGAREFHSEILMLSKLRHQHLVSLIGYCDEEEEMILVYDYMARGTLRDHLYKTDNPHLPWKQRLEICIGTAHGLHYLHTGTEYSIIHRDVKTTNILLDENWVAKVSDFGLSRVGPTSSSTTYVSTAVKGSFGYMDPEYFLRRQLTEKSDVYSFGVVLFEVLCARPPLVQTLEKEQVNLAEWARQCHRNGKLHQIIDRHMAGEIAPECLRKFGELAASCVHEEGIKRPPMNDVVWTLEFALKIQRDAERGIELGLPHPEHNEDTDDKTTVDDLFSDEKSGTCDSTSNGGLSSTCNSSSMAMAGGVFSEIMNPMAR